MKNLVYIISLLITFFILISDESLSRLIAQSIEDNGWIIFACGGEGNPDNTEIYRIRPDGSELQQLTDNNLNDSSPNWSPDGEWIAFIAERKQITFLWTIPSPK